MTPQVADLYAQLGIELHIGDSTEALARCFAAPEHHADQDRHPSASVNLMSGAWICHACGARGGAYDAARTQGHTPRSAMALLIAHDLAQPRNPGRIPQPELLRAPVQAERAPRPAPQSISIREADAFHHQLLEQPALLERLARERAITSATITTFGVGLDRGRITIPIIDPAGKLAGLLRWQPFDRTAGAKMLAHPGTRREIFPPPETIAAEHLLICEGEPDALAAHSAGIPAVAIPGIASWKPAWANRFAGHAVTVVLDCDFAGRQCTERVVQDLTAAGIQATALDLAPSRTDGYDLTDCLVSGARSPRLDSFGGSRPRYPPPRTR